MFVCSPACCCCCCSFFFFEVFLSFGKAGNDGGGEEVGERKKKRREKKLTPFSIPLSLFPVPFKKKKKKSRPGPWQVLRRRLRSDGSDGGTVCVWSSEERPSLKKVSLEILMDPRFR